MPLKNRSKAKHGNSKSKSKKRNNKQELSTTQSSDDIDINHIDKQSDPGYCTNRLLASLIGYMMAIIAYITTYSLLYFSGGTRDKLLKFSVENQKIFGLLFQPLISRKSIILPPDPVNPQLLDTTTTFYNGITQICIIAWLFHFVRRIFEVLCIHKYQSSRKWQYIIFVSFYYISLAIWISISTHSMIYTIYLNGPQFRNKDSMKRMVTIGLMIFVIGEIGNFIHHLLLRRMRGNGIKGHIIPHGGLFEYVSCPHYFFELISWFGFVLISITSIGSIAIFILSSLILSRRAMTKHEKYTQKFGDLYPKNRCAIIPFLL